MGMEAEGTPQHEGRPYRSHLHPACFSCRKRKSRCKTKVSAEVCMMCQAHGTECIFPRPEDPPTQQKSSPRKLAPTARSSRSSQSRNRPLHEPYPSPHIPSQARDTATSRTDQLPNPQIAVSLVGRAETSSTPEKGPRAEGLAHLMGIVADAGDDNSHIVSPAVADDNDILESYLSAIPTARQRYLIRTSSNSSKHLRPVRFNLVPRRPLGVTVNQSLAASKCEVIEKYMEPDIEEYLNLYFLKTNPCFPLFDEASFRGSYCAHKDKISPALLCNLYANSLVYWKNSARLSKGRIPDIRFIWNQANEALHSELFLSPGISTIMAILINVCGRPSTSMFGNGGMVGTAVALSNALGLNRDPSSWNISPLEKSLRIRLWWLVVIHDSWCSLAYGTPLQVHRAQYDVPFPSIDNICPSGATAYQRAAASIFIALATLTDVLSRYLEHVYSVSKSFPSPSNDMSETDLEQILRDWEETLSDDIRHVVLRGIHLDIPGAANFRLAYLAVKLLLRRIQLNLNKSSLQVEDDTLSPFYMHAQRAAEDIAYLMQELDESHFLGFWIPVHAFSLTSATMFLLRSGLRMRNESRNTPLKIARDMISSLRAHRQNFDWDLADNCLSHCGELIDSIISTESQSDGEFAPDFPSIPGNLDIDPSLMEDLFFGIPDFSEGFGI